MSDHSPPRVLVVEHDPDVGPPLVEQLAADGYRARLARTAGHARALARGDPPAIVLLGQLQPPDASLELLAEIRRPGESAWLAGLPVIVCGTLNHAADLLRAFEAGADDFLARRSLTRPAGYLELRARLRAVLRRACGPPADRGDRLLVGALALDLQARTACVDARPVPLCHQEYQLLAHLARQPHRVFTKQELLHAAWGYPVAIRTRTLDTHASRLRRKLRAADGGPWVINVRGVGYRLI
ncbi:MAG TPA: response regulator transcription factor [Solirubrobacteraceae bacterium]|nr:response regulator transcription factor [Solirubrobacteraceae bacterium]